MTLPKALAIMFMAALVIGGTMNAALHYIGHMPASYQLTPKKLTSAPSDNWGEHVAMSEASPPQHSNEVVNATVWELLK